MESFRILDSQISSSSVHTAVKYDARNGRLNYNRWDDRVSCWLPASNDGNAWLQVDFLWIVTVTQIWTQGRTRSITNPMWTKTYKVSYGGNGVDFLFYTENGVDKVS